MNLNLYDRDLNRVAIIGQSYVSCLWSEGYNTTEPFTLELVATESNKQKVKPDMFVGRDDRNTLMVIKSVEIVGKSLIASGKQATRVLDDVAFIGTISENQIIDTAIKSEYNKTGGYHNVVIENGNISDRYPGQISHKSFLQLCEIMSQSEDVGFRLVKKNKSAVVEFYKPEKNENLIFSEEFGNVFLDSVLFSTENKKNCVIVLGEGEEADRKIVTVDRSNGDQKLEMIVDARNVRFEEGDTEETYGKKLESFGIEELILRQPEKTFLFTPATGEFGKRYDLGDLISVRLGDYGVKLEARICRFTRKAQKNRVKTTVEVGRITTKR